MRIRAAIAIGLLGLAAACSTSNQAEPAPGPAFTTSASASAVASPLSVSWIPRLESLALQSCRSNQFSTSCLSAAMQLQTAAIELGGEADAQGNAAVKAEAVKAAADLQQYTDECVTSKPSTPARTKCLSLLVRLPDMHEGLVAAIHESEAK
jgi:hypothetical protein